MLPNSFYLFGIIGVLKTGYICNIIFRLKEKLSTLVEWKDLHEVKRLVVLIVRRDREQIDT